MEIKVVKVIGGKLRNEEQGIILRNAIISALGKTKDEEVIVDFRGVTLCLQVVVHNGIAKLFRKYNPEVVAERVRVVGLDYQSQESLRRYLKNAGITTFEGKY